MRRLFFKKFTQFCKYAYGVSGAPKKDLVVSGRGCQIFCGSSNLSRATPVVAPTGASGSPSGATHEFLWRAAASRQARLTLAPLTSKAVGGLGIAALPVACETHGGGCDRHVAGLSHRSGWRIPMTGIERIADAGSPAIGSTFCVW